jgi:two-component system, LytTR family, response regulator
MSLRVLLVDDEPLALARLTAALRNLADVTVIGAASDGEGAIDQICEFKPDLVLLDIQMPGLDGLGVAAALSSLVHRPEVVFITAFDQYAADAFQVEAVDYLLKPVKFDRLRQALDRAQRRREMRQATGRAAELELEINQLRSLEAPQEVCDTEFWVPTLHGVKRVLLANINWIEAARDYVLLHTATRSHLFRATMSGLERRLDPNQMMRVHRSSFVRPGAVAEVQRQGKGLYALKLNDGAVIQVGPTYATALLAALNVDMGRLEPG